MKKSIIIVVAIVILGLVVWALGKNNGPVVPGQNGTASTTPTVSAVVTETTKISDKLSEYKNEELGFSVKYPSVWEAAAFDSGVTFVVPTGKADSNTIGKLEAKIIVGSGKCQFPPVTTVKERSTVTSGKLSFNMISIANTVQGRNYFDRLYSLQKENICYYFTLSSITLSPASKGLKGSEATQMSNNNKALIDSADTAFTSVVKSFAYVIGAQGKDETQVVPTKK